MTSVPPARVLIADDRNDPLLHDVIEALLELVQPTNPRKEEKVDAGAPRAPVAMGRARGLFRSGKPPPHCV
jgi:hypothetical protein